MEIYIVRIRGDDRFIEMPQTKSLAQAKKYKKELDEQYGWQGNEAHIWVIEL